MDRYTLNVAVKFQSRGEQRTKHYCRIEIPETMEAEALERARQIAKQFDDDRFVIELTRWEEHGVTVPL